MNIRLRFLALLLLKTQFIWASIDRTYYRSLSEDAQYKFANDYFIKHWFEYFDVKKKAAPMADYKFMQSEAKSPKMICFFRFFWHRNQIISDRLAEKGEAMLADLRSFIEYAHDHHLIIEENISRMEWCIGVLENKGNMSDSTRRILIYDEALLALTNLQKQPLADLLNFHGPVYDIDHRLWWMSMYFFRIEEYEIARQVALLGEKVVHPQLSTMPGHNHGYNFYRWQFLNDLGSCHLRLGKLPEAALWYQKAYTFGLSHGTSVQACVSYGNLGVVFGKQGKYAAAILYLERAIQGFGNDYQSEFNALVPLSEVYLNLKQYDKAYPALVRSIALLDSVKAYVSYRDSLDIIPLFAGLGVVYQHRGDLKKALLYSQLANRLEGKKRKLDANRLYRQKKEKLDAEIYRANLTKMADDRKQAVVLLNFSIVGLIAIMAFSLVYILNQRRRRREVEEKLTQIVQQVRERSEQLNQLQQETQSEPDSTSPSYSKLMEQVILTEADWERFQQLFKQVHPKFLDRLRKDYPTLTPAETRIICLSRLSLSTKEMANMLGVSTDTIFKTRYRIRKKVNLPEGMDINEAFAEL